MNTARKDWMTLETLDTEMPLTDDFAQPPLPALGGRVNCRSIYVASAMEDPIARRIIEACTEAGEQARLLRTVPMKMKLADHTTAMLPLTPTGTAGPWWSGRRSSSPRCVSTLSCSGTAQRRSSPSVRHRADRLTPAQQAVLELMAEGLHDDAIAHRAGSARPPSAATSPPSCTASASGAGSPQVQLPSDGAGLASQHIRRRLMPIGKRKASLGYAAATANAERHRASGS